MISDDYILASYVRKNFPFIEKSLDYTLYSVNIQPSELFAALKRYQEELEGKTDVASCDSCGSRGDDSGERGDP